MKNRSLVSFSALVIFCLTLAFFSGYFTHAYLNPDPAGLPLLQQAYGILANHAYDPLPPEPALEYGMIRGMLQAYADPHTYFVEPAQHELGSDELHGSFGGIGVRLVSSTEGEVLLYPIPESPAALAGLIDGDILRQVEDLVVRPGTGMDEIEAALRGPVGQRVAIVVLRPGQDQPLDFNIRRASVALPSVTWHLVPGSRQVGVLEINLLASSTPEEVKTAVSDLQAQGATHFILDLRDNSGGLLTAGVDTARLFLNQGEIIQQQYRGEPVETFEVNRPGPLADLPLVVLINQNTASAAEIVAGALKINDRAPLLGQHTYGKDSIQLVFELEDRSSLHVTAARWWVPDLAPPLGEGGIQPDISLTGQDPNPDAAVHHAARVVLGAGD
jgi:carboxyl-terminal processing protease